LRKVWQALLADGSGLPGGTRPLLMAAEVRSGGEGEVVLRLPANSMLVESLEQPAQRRPLEAALSERLGTPVRLRMEIGGKDTGPPELTAEHIRGERLKRLAEEEPVLQQAVKDWDLELLD
jgi:hypothetical protein